MRLWIFGAPGSGKTTLARQLAQHFQIPSCELDNLFWSSGWKINPQSIFLANVRSMVAQDCWIIEGAYASAAPTLNNRATLAIWLDLSFATTYPRVLRRSLRDAWKGKELFSENKESFRRLFSKDGMPAYALLQHARNRKKLESFWSGFPGKKVRFTHVGSVLQSAIEACELHSEASEQLANG